MKKLLAIFLTVLISLNLIGCGNSGKYEEAKSALNSGDYNTAIAVLEELAADNYEDSSELLKEAKYLYLKDNLDRDDSRSIVYLEALREENYKDTQKMYDDLYSWKAKIAISTTKQSSVHRDEVNATSQLFPFYYFNFRIYDGPLDGEFRGTYEIVFSNGQKTSDTYIGRDNDFYFAITLSATQNPIGKTTFNVYGENGELLATATSNIK